MTWYDPDELKAQADSSQTQPEFPRDVEPDTSEESVDGFLDEFVDEYTVWKDEFDANYVPPPNN